MGSTLFRLVLGLAGAGLLLTLAGLASRGYIERSLIDPAAPPEVTDLLQGRGFPLLWWVTEEGVRGRGLTGPQRFLEGRFAASWSGNTIAAAFVAAGWWLIRRRAARHEESYRAPRSRNEVRR
jgi:hypothetical protein